MKLYEIANEYRDIEVMLDESGGEITPDIEQMLVLVDAELPAKVDAICGLIVEAETKSLAFKNEAKRLQSLADIAEHKADRLREYVRRCLSIADKRVVEGELFIARRGTAGTPSIRWAADAPIPRAFVRITESLDGKKAHEAFKGGTLPDGFKVERSEFLEIR